MTSTWKVDGGGLKISSKVILFLKKRSFAHFCGWRESEEGSQN